MPIAIKIVITFLLMGAILTVFGGIFDFIKELISPSPYGLFNGIDGRLMSLGMAMIGIAFDMILIGLIFVVWCK